MLTIEELLSEQRELQEALAPGGLVEEDAPLHLLAATAELMEALQELNWKPWRKTKHHTNRDHYATELTDALQFWANAAIALGLTADDLTQALRAKWAINWRRIREDY